MASGYFDESVLEGHRRAATVQRDTDLAKNAYARFLSQQRGERNITDVNEKAKTAFHQVPQSYGRRGMVNSGQYRVGLQKAAMQRFQMQDTARTDLQSQLRQHDDQALTIQAQYQRALADAELQVRLQQQQAAAQLLALRGGG